VTEEPLSGGNASTGVVRVGDTVRRPAGPWTPAVHALLHHLHAAGFTAAPRPLGVDEQGREVLTFARGATVWPERFPLMAPDARLRRVARLIRDFHEAVTGFRPPADARWNVLMPADGAEIIAHRDLAPWNLVIDDATDTWTFIDWDFAAPGTRLWDIAYAVRGFAPLSGNPAFRLPDPAAAARLRLFADAYGLDDEADRRALVPLLGVRSRGMYDFLKDQSARGNAPWAGLWDEGHGDAWLSDAEYAEARAELWTRALLD
jgi:aminoglycoside phosphotransferase (APT) family kinase protein